jgi:hypothetical protein
MTGDRMRRAKGREKGRRELLEKPREMNASLYLAEGAGEGPARTPYRRRRAVKAVTGPLNRMA